MASEGEFPKVNGDVLYASEVNNFNNEFKDKVNQMFYLSKGEYLIIDNNNNTVINFGQNYGSGLAYKPYITSNKLFIDTTLTNVIARDNSYIPRVTGSDAGSVFISDTFYSTGSFITPYVNYEVLTNYDECDNSSVEGDKWFSGGTIREGTNYLSFSGTSFIQTKNIIPPGVTKIYVNADYQANEQSSTGINSGFLLVGSNIGSKYICQKGDSAGISQAGTLNLFSELNFDEGKTVVNVNQYGYSNKDSGLIKGKERVDLSSYTGSLYLKFSTDSNNAILYLQNVHWWDRNANYQSAGSLYVSNDGGNSWNLVTNGGTYAFATLGSKFKLKMEYNPIGSEIIQQNSWGMKIF